MKQVSTLFLKIVVFLIGLPVLALCIFIVPEFGKLAEVLYPDKIYIKVLVLTYLYLSAVPYYFALYQAFKLLGFIDKNIAFSEHSVVALRKIRNSALSISVVHTLGLPLVYMLAEKDDAPGLILIALIIIFASLVISVFAAVLQKLLIEVIDIKNENDLTV